MLKVYMYFRPIFPIIEYDNIFSIKTQRLKNFVTRAEDIASTIERSKM